MLIISAFTSTGLDATETAEWAKKIVELYINWYTFFITANLIALGWFYAKDSSRPPSGMCFIFVIQNLLGIATSILIGYFIAPEAGKFFWLVVLCCLFNAIALTTIAAIWLITLKNNSRKVNAHKTR
jgi:hypothetical protein